MKSVIQKQFPIHGATAAILQYQRIDRLNFDFRIKKNFNRSKSQMNSNILKTIIKKKFT